MVNLFAFVRLSVVLKTEWYEACSPSLTKLEFLSAFPTVAEPLPVGTALPNITVRLVDSSLNQPCGASAVRRGWHSISASLYGAPNGVDSVPANVSLSAEGGFELSLSLNASGEAVDTVTFSQLQLTGAPGSVVGDAVCFAFTAFGSNGSANFSHSTVPSVGSCVVFLAQAISMWVAEPSSGWRGRLLDVQPVLTLLDSHLAPVLSIADAVKVSLTFAVPPPVPQLVLPESGSLSGTLQMLPSQGVVAFTDLTVHIAWHAYSLAAEAVCLSAYPCSVLAFPPPPLIVSAPFAIFEAFSASFPDPLFAGTLSVNQATAGFVVSLRTAIHTQAVVSAMTGAYSLSLLLNDASNLDFTSPHTEPPAFSFQPQATIMVEPLSDATVNASFAFSPLAVPIVGNLTLVAVALPPLFQNYSGVVSSPFLVTSGPPSFRQQPASLSFANNYAVIDPVVGMTDASEYCVQFVLELVLVVVDGVVMWYGGVVW